MIQEMTPSEATLIREKVLEETLTNWDFDFEKKKRITIKNSFFLN